MCGIRFDRYAVPSGLVGMWRLCCIVCHISCHISNRRVKTLRWDMPSLQDLYHRLNRIVLKGRYNTAWGFNPMKIKNV